jgi:hypothetical protein
VFCWKVAESFEWKQIEAISLVLSNHYKLLEFLFETDRPSLRSSPEQLLEWSEGFSSGEQTLIRVALDIWSSSGNARICELLKTLDQDNFDNVLSGLQYLGGKQSDGGTSNFAN